MVAGDVVNGFGAVNSSLTFQPASGVECMITNANTGSGDAWVNLTNATVGINGYLFNTGSSTSQVAYGSRFQGYKLFINNTNYLLVFAPPAAGEYSSYTGIQIK
jgi:hypothetical protein